MYNPTEKFDTLKPAKSPKRFLKSKILQGLGATSGGWAPFPTNTERNIERKILLQAPGTLAPASGGGGGGGGLLGGTLGYWKLDETGTPTTYADATGNGWTATKNGGALVTPTVSGIINGGQQIQTAAGIGAIWVSANIDTRASSTPFATSLWINSGGVGINGSALVGEWGTRNDWVIFQSGTGDHITLRTSNDSGVTTDVVIGLLSIGVFTHIIVGYDGTNTKVIVNGGTALTGSPTNVRRGGGAFVIGNYQSFSDSWLGVFDEVAYFNFFPNATQVGALYNGGAGLPFSSYS